MESERVKQSSRFGEEIGARYRLLLPDKPLSGRGGDRLSNAVGSSLEFKDFRPYQPGDDPRSVDWNVYARSDQLTIKTYHREINPRVDLSLDCSLSMATPDRKAEAAIALCAALATAASNAKRSRRVWLTEATGFRELPNGAGAVAEWGDIAFANDASPAASYRALAPRFAPWSARIFIGDLLWLDSPETFLAMMGRQAAWLIVVELRCVEELSPAARGNVRLEDAETGELIELFIDETTVAAYRSRLDAHRQNWRRACREIGATLVSVTAEDFLDSGKLDALMESQILGPV